MATATVLTAPMRQFLTWVRERPRTYADAMDAWRSSCPRLSVWEDALDAGYALTTRDVETGEVRVVLTPRGKAALGRT